VRDSFGAGAEGAVPKVDRYIKKGVGALTPSQESAESWVVKTGELVPKT
jgi:hypothetical protein